MTRWCALANFQPRAMKAWPLFVILLSCDSAPAEPPCLLPQEEPKFVELASDGTAILALRSDGRAICWGEDGAGKCGFPYVTVP